MHDHDLGLSHDLHTAALRRRRALQWLAALGGSALAGCGGGGDDTSGTSSTDASTTTTTTGTAGTASCAVVPEETAGPYPGDGSNNNVNALVLAGIVRSDIRESFAGATGVAEGVPLTLRLRLVNTSGSCAALSGYAIYLWHCDREGRYSLYSSGVTGENYLRGVQIADATGTVTFTSIYPACYDGRWPHIHFEVYPDQASSADASSAIATSQVAMPQDICRTVYATSGYEQSKTNLGKVSLTTDNVFGDDGGVSQIPTVTGDVSGGYTVALTAAVDTTTTPTGGSMGGRPGGGAPPSR
jgi:protocatechuate 3,4-dioxygenase beta subunit